MIGGAVYQLLNVNDLTSLVAQLNYGIAAQENVFPRVVITESGTPENFKDGYSIVNHDVEINIFASKSKDGNGGFLQANNISTVIENILYRYKGTIGGKRIDQTLLSNKEVLFDNMSQCARVIMEYAIRETVINARTIEANYRARILADNGILENAVCLFSFLNDITITE
jgi:hypothetical protein